MPMMVRPPPRPAGILQVHRLKLFAVMIQSEAAVNGITRECLVCADQYSGGARIN